MAEKRQTWKTIADFHSSRISKDSIKYDCTQEPICTVGDYYAEFLPNRLPRKEYVEAWHDLLIEYINEDGATLIVRKYEGGKKIKSGITGEVQSFNFKTAWK